MGRHLDKMDRQDNTFNTDVLAPPVAWTGYGNSDSKDAFLREYGWIKETLEKTYPGHEFKIVPEELHITRIMGWQRLDGIYWRGHSLFKRRLAGSARAA